MPITGSGWEILIQREREERHNKRRRTVGHYQVHRDGVLVAGLSGACAEARGPGDNAEEDNGRRVEPGRYPLFTQAGGKYVTIGYKIATLPSVLPKPGIELKETGERREILIHPGYGFLSAVGCINLTTALPLAESRMDFVDSRDRVIAVIDDLRAFLGANFPTKNGRAIPNAWAVIEGEPALP
jgi:hypothetical protein